MTKAATAKKCTLWQTVRWGRCRCADDTCGEGLPRNAAPLPPPANHRPHTPCSGGNAAAPPSRAPRTGSHSPPPALCPPAQELIQIRGCRGGWQGIEITPGAICAGGPWHPGKDLPTLPQTRIPACLLLPAALYIIPWGLPIMQTKDSRSPRELAEQRDRASRHAAQRIILSGV